MHVATCTRRDAGVRTRVAGARRAHARGRSCIPWKAPQLESHGKDVHHSSRTAEFYAAGTRNVPSLVCCYAGVKQRMG